MEIRISPKLGQGMSLTEGINKFIKYMEIVRHYDEIEKFYNKNHNQEHFILEKGKIWLKGNGEGKYWDYLCSSRKGQRDAHEILKI